MAVDGAVVVVHVDASVLILMAVAAAATMPLRLQCVAAERTVRDLRAEIETLKDDRAIRVKEEEITRLREELASTQRVKEDLAALLEEVRSRAR